MEMVRYFIWLGALRWLCKVFEQ